MDQRIINLYDSFTHGQIDRREFIERAATIVGSAAAAVALLPVMANDYAKAATIAANDARLASETMSYDAPKGKIAAYITRLKDKSKRPTVIVIHENRGLNPHIEDIARRLATAGYLAIAPDLLSVAGGTPASEDAARDLHTKANKRDMLNAAIAAIAFAKMHPESTGKVGAVGFCYGGGVVNGMAVASADLAAGVAYYGQQPPADKVSSIQASLLLHYAGLDERIDAGIPAYEEALKKGGKRYSIYIYPKVNHAFNNDTGNRYDKAASDLAWSRTLAFFKENLS